MTNLYAMADRAIKAMNRENLKAFGRLKLAKWDEINIVRMVGVVYDESARLAQKRYLEVAKDAYIRAMAEAGMSRKEAERYAWEDITMLWVLGMLDGVDPVMMYSFAAETERKKQRLIEALSVAENKNQEIDRALRAWTVQVAQFADNAVYRARMDAFRAAGIENVMWVTQRDNRVCRECDDLNGEIFPIDAVPPPQHPHCRCYVVQA